MRCCAARMSGATLKTGPRKVEAGRASSRRAAMTALLAPGGLPGGLPRAAALLQAGELVAFGTETVYGLGADATNAAAVAAIFAAKGRPRFNPLICHFATAEDAFAEVHATPLAQRLAARFWPGPLTLVLPRRPRSRIALLAGAGLDTLAVRVPGHASALALIRAAGRPIAAPSANLSGRISPTRAEHVLAQLEGRIAAILDSGPCPAGVESTVLDLSRERPVLLRPGAVPAEALLAETGPLARPTGLGPELGPELGRELGRGAEPGAALRSPGLMSQHYAPRLPLRLNAVAAGADAALLAFGPAPPAPLTFQLSETMNLTEAAARLFEGLHWLDAAAPKHGLRRIAAMPIPETGLGAAINDRLRRAAAPL